VQLLLLYLAKYKIAFCVFCCFQVNNRGKVASRPGPGSKSFEEAQQLLAQQQQGVSPAEVTAQLEQKQQPQSQPQQPSAAAAAPQQQSSRQAITETPQVCYNLKLG
jgi:preprotein translocase subunit SecD